MELKIVAVDERNAFKHVWEVDDEVSIEAGSPAVRGIYRVTHVKGETYGPSGMRWTYTVSLLRKEYP